jgi:hypothetical protein
MVFQKSEKIEFLSKNFMDLKIYTTIFTSFDAQFNIT